MAVDHSGLISIFLKVSPQTIFCNAWIKSDDFCVIASSLYNLYKDYFTMKKLTKALNTKEGKVIKKSNV